MSTALCPNPLYLVPGPQGPAGDDGVDGVDGSPASTELSAAFTVPAIAASADATVVDSSWAIIGSPVYLQNAGTFIVTAVPDATTITLQNPTGYPDNVAAATVIPIASNLGPSGFIGPAGTAGTSGTGITVAAQGDIQTHDGTNPTNQSIGTNDQTLHADSTSATGMDWRAIDLTGVTTDLTGDLAVAEGGTGASTAAAAATNLAVLPTAGGTMTGPILTSGTTPANKLIETDAALDEKRWEVRAESADLKFQAVNDAESVRTDWLKVERTGTVVDRITLTATALVLAGAISPASSILAGNIQIPTGTVALINGANNDVVLGDGAFFRITGPTGAFSISGITNGAPGAVGRLVILHNTTAFAMTITDTSTSVSAAINQIISGTGGDPATTGTGFAILLYDTTAARWILLALAV